MMDIVLKEEGYLLASKILTDTPGICDTAKTYLVRGLYYIINVGEPEVPIELGDCKDNGITAVLLHFNKILFSVLYIVKSVIAYGSMLD
jgi:hypothetical protein